MRLLDRKLLRDISAMRGQVVTIALVVAAGVAVFVASVSTYDSLRSGRDRFYATARFPQVFVSLKRAPLSIVVQLNDIPGVQACPLEKGFEGADGVFVMNNHPSYEDWNLLALLETMHKPALFVDGWSMFRADDITRVPGISYSSVSQDRWE